MTATPDRPDDLSTSGSRLAWLKHYPEGVDWNAELPTAPLDRMLDATARRFPDHAAWNFFSRRTS